ncbi:MULTISPECIES: ScbA/BarX family gamma-butyrolactone biosynthesis protein [unclassified Streptomyces]|uniref:ScbA/BarX family gamma-butyrolactone biosynthesis protein n=1 Tax=unclassified Streptomyces TaxID=2593676 RepID=UPI0030774FB1
MPPHETVGNCIAEPVSGRVPQHYVHKTNASEVYLRSWTGFGEDHFRIDALWPDAHPFYRVADTLDPLLLSETIRQTFPLLCHAAYGVPLGDQLIWERFSYLILEPADPADAPVRGRDVELHVRCYDISYRGSRPTALSMWMTVTRDGVPVARAETRFAVMAKRVYQRLRGAYADIPTAMSNAVPVPRPVPVRPARFHRASTDDVLLTAPDADGAQWLRVATDHPIFFDHPVDHVPGMLLLEAAHQAAIGAGSAPDPAGPGVPGAEILSLSCDFKRYVELDSPCALFTEELPVDASATSGNRRTAVKAVQNDLVAFTAELTTTAPSAPTTPSLQQAHCGAAGASRGGALS